MTSVNLGGYQTLGPLGQNNIIKKIPVTSEYGTTLFDRITSAHDHMDVSKQMLKTLEFRLTDGYGKVIDLNGLPVSFSLVFTEACFFFQKLRIIS